MLNLRCHFEKVLNSCLDQLRTYIHQEGKCCRFKNFIANMPDYNDRQFQYLYILRYYPAYLCEYRTIYRNALPYLQMEPSISVQSFGVGSLVDMNGLAYALDDLDISQDRINYTGYEIADWKQVKHPDIRFKRYLYRVDIADITPCTQSANLLIFPKSITDFSPNSFKKFVNEYIENSTFTADRMVLASAISPRNNGYYRNISQAKFKRVAELFINKGYRVVNSYENIYTPFDDGQKHFWGGEYRDFCIPQNVVHFSRYLSSECPNVRLNGRTCYECENELDKYPLFNAHGLSYQVAYLESSNIAPGGGQNLKTLDGLDYDFDPDDMPF